jgi:hypothetical protein
MPHSSRSNSTLPKFTDWPALGCGALALAAVVNDSAFESRGSSDREDIPINPAIATKAQDHRFVAERIRNMQSLQRLRNETPIKTM